jgi:hypothetical protein
MAIVVRKSFSYSVKSQIPDATSRRYGHESHGRGAGGPTGVVTRR